MGVGMMCREHIPSPTSPEKSERDQSVRVHVACSLNPTRNPYSSASAVCITAELCLPAPQAWLTKRTEITEITPVPESLSRYAYKLKSLQNLLATADVIGIVTGVSPAVTIDMKGRPTSQRTLRLTDTRETATVALWSENAEAIDSEMLIDVGSREPVVALVMGCTYKKRNLVLELSASYGSLVYINADIPEIVALRDRLVGSVQPVEIIMERGRCIESNEAEVVAVMNLHAATGKKFRSKITIDGLQPNQGWWFLSCDDCSWKSVEEGTGHSCTKEKCGGKKASPRLRIPVIASGDGASKWSSLVTWLGISSASLLMF